jgi:hypothetical protein
LLRLPCFSPFVWKELTEPVGDECAGDRENDGPKGAGLRKPDCSNWSLGKDNESRCGLGTQRHELKVHRLLPAPFLASEQWISRLNGHTNLQLRTPD